MNTRFFTQYFLIPGTILASGFFLVYQVLPQIGYSPQFNSVFSLAQAREDEDEEDDDEDEDEDEDEEHTSTQTTSTSTKSSASSTKQTTTTKEVIEYQPVTETIIVIDPLYQQDSDGDGLVDGLDPDPATDQRLYFTDDDGDGMPNIWDRYPGEDDFAYLNEETDTNQNGLIDAYE